MSATASTATQPKPLEWLNRLRANPRIPLIVAGSAAVAIVVAMVLWAKTPDYRTLFSNLSDQDGGAIVAQLTQMNIPYRFANGSGAIEVPADKVHELRLRLAQQGLPKGGAVGFELLDQEKFGISQFSEQVNYQRALEGERPDDRDSGSGKKRPRSPGDAKAVAICAGTKIPFRLRHRHTGTGTGTG